MPHHVSRLSFTFPSTVVPSPSATCASGSAWLHAEVATENAIPLHFIKAVRLFFPSLGLHSCHSLCWSLFSKASFLHCCFPFPTIYPSCLLSKCVLRHSSPRCCSQLWCWHTVISRRHRRASQVLQCKKSAVNRQYPPFLPMVLDHLVYFSSSIPKPNANSNREYSFQRLSRLQHFPLQRCSVRRQPSQRPIIRCRRYHRLQSATPYSARGPSQRLYHRLG
jgi:hypothetical protein